MKELGGLSQGNILDNAIKACKSIFIYTLIFSFISNLLVLALPIYSLQVLDRVISSHSIYTLVMLSIVVFAAFLSLNLLQAARSFVLIRMGDWFDRKLSKDLLMNSISVAVVSRSVAGSQNLRDLNTLKSFLTGPALNSLLDAPWSLIFIVALFFIHPVYGYISLLGGITLLGLAVLNEKATKDALSKSNEHFIKSMNQVEIATRNSEVVEAMGMSKYVAKSWHDLNQEGLMLQNLASNRSTVISTITKILRMFIQMLITGCGGYLVLQNEMSVGAMIAGSIIVGRALAPFESAITSWKGVISARISYSRLKKAIEKFSLRPKAMQLPAPTGKIDVENIFFAPPGSQKAIIKGVSFSIAAGDILGLIGPSAAGKSTLAKLIASILKPNSGVVRLDGADIYTWDRDDIGNHVGYLPQDVELFNGTIKDNIARMNPEANPEDIVKAAKIAGVHDMILSLPTGYETDIGIGGSMLSAGQRQRVALARAFYGNPKLVILDEPNSNLDQEGDNGLAAALIYAKENNITVIIISHRPSITPYVDKILVMKDGTVAMMGNRDEILEKLQGGNKVNLPVREVKG